MSISLTLKRKQQNTKGHCLKVILPHFGEYLRFIDPSEVFLLVCHKKQQKYGSFNVRVLSHVLIAKPP